jgi:hypothetical protein
MKPILHEYTSRAGTLGEIIGCISDFECSSYFGAHLDRDQNEQRLIVSNFQLSICLGLTQAVTNLKWQQEYTPGSSNRDSIDIFGSNDELSVVIELDKHRADQVAKKFVSRTALFEKKRIFYISLCYPGTSNMNSSECKKYFTYCKNLSTRLGNEYAGFIIV